MKRPLFIFAAVSVFLMLSGCGLYGKYKQTAPMPSDAFGTEPGIQAAMGDSSIATISWREFFTDPLLQQLIDQALANNTDLNSARIAVEQSEAALKSAKLAFLPALYFSPQGSLAKFDNSSWSSSYTLPLQLSWDIDLFGSLTNKKRAAKAVFLQAQMQREVVYANLISTTAQQYFLLQVLDRQLEILSQTDSLWNKSLETEKALWENGKAYSTAVNQLEASYLSVKAQMADTRRSIRSVENAICRLLAIPPQHISRQRWSDQPLSPLASHSLPLGLPASMIELRPDIRLANHALEEAFYNTQAARAAFFPSISLSGLAGWTNSAGGIVVDPAGLLLNLVGQLTQPIFARGSIKANLKISKLAQEDLQKRYVQAVIDAGNQVNEAMADYQVASEKQLLYHRQVQVLYDAYSGTHQLMDNGKASYLEVLTAQESLLTAQLSEAMNMYDAAKAVIALYIALGGGTK